VTGVETVKELFDKIKEEFGKIGEELDQL